MERLEKILITAIILVAIVTVFYFASGWISVTTGYAIKSDDAGVVAGCFADKGAKLYTSPNCPSCERQENELSEFASGLETVDCSQNTQSCLVLSSLPAIEYDNKFYYGFKTSDEVREIVDC